MIALAVGVHHTFVFFSSWSEVAGDVTKATTAGAQAVDAAGKVGGFLVGKVSTAVVHRQGQLMFRYIAGRGSHLGTWTYEVWLTGYPGRPGEIVR
ncbi:MAG: hypothetical protein ABJA34_12190 [Pseudonocardiales bacterium]